MNGITEILQLSIPIILTNFFTWFMTRKKERADGKRADLDNVERIVSVWRSLAENMEGRYQDALKKIDALEKKVDDCQENHRIRNAKNEK